MKKEFFQTIEVPSGIEIEIEGTTIKVRGPNGENSREFNLHDIVFEKKGNEIIIGSKKATKKEKKMINTTRSHINNMIQGAAKNFEYKLKICYNHFPFTVEVKGREALVKNFLGEKIPRKVEIPAGVKVKIDKDIIEISSHNKELAGQTAANFENSTRIRLRDRRVFQDGLFITEKSGREI